jgi:CubicO group peptidase (beta-lactamase class C family)
MIEKRFERSAKLLMQSLFLRVSIFLIISFLLVISVSDVRATTKAKENASLQEFNAYLDELIPDLLEDYSIPGVAISIIQNGTSAWSKAYGYADFEQGRKMTTDTYCRVESISKSVTAWGVMKLVEQGNIDLDKPIKQYIKNWDIPESKFPEEKVTVRQLLTNTSGMPLGDIFERYSPNDKIPTLRESLSEHAILIQEPGASFLYSNTGYNLLELLIEEVTGCDFAVYMEEEVLHPLGMYKSSFTWSEELHPEVPVGYDSKGKPIPVYIYPEKGSGGLFASVDDIASFVSAGMLDYFHSENKVLTKESINSLYTAMVEKPGIYGLVFDSYGLGYYLDTLPNGKLSVANGGQGGGVMTFFQAVPDTGDGIVILTNSQRSWPFFGYVLSNWSKWRGFGSVGMERIIWAQNALWLLIGLLWTTLLWQIWGLVVGIAYRKRRFLPLWKEFRVLPLIQNIFAITLAAILIWCSRQDYLFISSVFPIAYAWLGFSLLILIVVLMLLALFPGTKVDDNNELE